VKSLAALLLIPALGVVPALAETTTITTSRGNETTVRSSDGSSYTSTMERVGPNQYRSTSTYIPPSSYQPMKGYQPMGHYCPMGNCK